MTVRDDLDDQIEEARLELRALAAVVGPGGTVLDAAVPGWAPRERVLPFADGIWAAGRREDWARFMVAMTDECVALDLWWDGSVLRRSAVSA